MNLTIGEIAEACGGKLVGKNLTECDICVSSVVIDSRKVEAGGVFLATVGERVDGHKFISQVYTQGALLAITQKTPEQVARETGMDCSHWGCYCLVEDTLQALKDIAEFYRRKVGLPVVGITGSVGKTSTKEFIAGVLSEKFQVLKTEGNYNNEIGVPLTLLRIRPEHQVAVVEMGISDFGEMHRLSKMVRPDVCVITNIGQCHLENLKTRDGILKAKSEIFDFMAENGEICLNGEDDKLITLSEVKGRKPHFFGLGGNECEEVYAGEMVSHGLLGSDAVLHMSAAGAIAVHVPLPGKHMVLNAAAAACVGTLFGLTGQEIAVGIAGMEPVSGRNNLVSLKYCTLIDDCYNANPASMRAAIDLLAMADTEKVAILGDMFELGEGSDALHAGVGEYAVHAGIDRILCVGENARHMYEAAVAAAGEKSGVEYFPDRDALLDSLKNNPGNYLPEGCTVLLKASHGMEFGKVLDSILLLAESIAP
ncbi:MAG: UDP-N-acetylmuramoyl-tripeptide--D-alanyl-D-alanine ligase [Acetatifactor sp.]